MLSVLASILPEYCALIASGIKTVEVRKTRPKIDTPFKVYVYCTLPKASGDAFLIGEPPRCANGKVIGEFVCDNIEIIKKTDYHPNYYFTWTGTCLEPSEMWEYGKGKPLYAWHISDLVIYDKPKELSEFSSGSSRLEFSNTEDGFPLKWSGMKRPPQSWCYVEK